MASVMLTSPARATPLQVSASSSHPVFTPKPALPTLPSLPQVDGDEDVFISLGYIWRAEGSYKTAKQLYMPLMRNLKVMNPEIDWSKLEIWLDFYRSRRRARDMHSYLRGEDIETFVDYMVYYHPIGYIGQRATVANQQGFYAEITSYFVRWDLTLKRSILKRLETGVFSPPENPLTSNASCLILSQRVQLPTKRRQLIRKIVDDTIETVTRAMIAINNAIHAGGKCMGGCCNQAMLPVATPRSSFKSPGSYYMVPSTQPTPKIRLIEQVATSIGTPDSNTKRESTPMTAKAFDETGSEALAEYAERLDEKKMAMKPPTTTTPSERSQNTLAVSSTPPAKKRTKPRYVISDRHSQTSSPPPIIWNRRGIKFPPPPRRSKPSPPGSQDTSSQLLDLIYKRGTPIGVDTTPHLAMFAEQRREKEKKEKERILKEIGVEEENKENSGEYKENMQASTEGPKNKDDTLDGNENMDDSSDKENVERFGNEREDIEDAGDN